MPEAVRWTMADAGFVLRGAMDLSARASSRSRAGVALLLGRHRVDLRHLLPAADPRRHAAPRAPSSQRVVGPVELGTAAAGAQRGALKLVGAAGGCFADCNGHASRRPRRRSGGSALSQRSSSCNATTSGSLAASPSSASVASSAAGRFEAAALLTKIACRVVGQLAPREAASVLQQRHGLARGAQPAGVDRKAPYATPRRRASSRPPALPPSARSRRRRRVARASGKRLVLHVLAGLVSRAARRSNCHLAVVVHAETRVLDGEVGPSRRLPSSSSQSLEHNRSRRRVAGQRVEASSSLLLRLGQAVAELEVVGPLRQRVVGRHRRGAAPPRGPLRSFLRSASRASTIARRRRGRRRRSKGIARLTKQRQRRCASSRDSVTPYTAQAFFVRFNIVVLFFVPAGAVTATPNPAPSCARPCAASARAVCAVGRLQGRRGHAGRAF